MIRHIEALEYLGLAAGGRNEPLQVTGIDGDGELLDLYLKPSGRPELGFEGLSNELLAAMIAGELGLPVCEPLIVSMTPEWIATIPDESLRAVLQQSCPLAFGSRGAGKGWKLWSDWPAAGLVDTEIGCFHLSEVHNAKKEVQPRVQA